MRVLSGGSGKRPNTGDFRSCSAQPRNVSSVPEVSPFLKPPAVRLNVCPGTVRRIVASTPATLVSSATQVLIADGRDGVGHRPVQAVVLQRNRRIEHAGAGRQPQGRAGPRAIGQIAFAQIDQMPLTVLALADDHGRQGVGEARVPDQRGFAQAQALVAVAEPGLADRAVDPRGLAIGRHEAQDRRGPIACRGRQIGLRARRASARQA
jgi:hypothetical protein